MPARTGAAYNAGLRESPPELHIHGERVKDVTTHPDLRHGVQTLAKLYDMQHDPALRDEMTYVSPTTGERAGLSFITPQSHEDLARRHTMMRHWARHLRRRRAVRRATTGSPRNAARRPRSPTGGLLPPGPGTPPDRH